MNEFLKVLNLDLISDEAENFIRKWNLEEDPEGPIGESLYFTSPQKGIEILIDFNSLKIKSIFLHDGSDDYSQFTHIHEYGLSFDWTRDDVHDRYGESAKRAGGPLKTPTQIIDGYDRFDYDPHSIHLSYSHPLGTVNLITIMTPDQRP